jgi:hypothetical protein
LEDTRRGSRIAASARATGRRVTHRVPIGRHRPAARRPQHVQLQPRDAARLHLRRRNAHAVPFTP